METKLAKTSPLFEEFLGLSALNLASVKIALHTRKLFHIIGSLFSGDGPDTLAIFGFVKIVRRCPSVAFGIGLIASATC